MEFHGAGGDILVGTVPFVRLPAFQVHWNQIDEHRNEQGAMHGAARPIPFGLLTRAQSAGSGVYRADDSEKRPG